MKAPDAQSLRIEINPDEAVSALLIQPAQARACYVFAHGAGAGMAHASMETIAAGLGERGIATLRYQFPYMEKGSKRPDAPKVAHAAVRAAVAEAGRRLPSLPLIAGGKSFGGRMTSQAQAPSNSTTGEAVQRVGSLRNGTMSASQSSASQSKACHSACPRVRNASSTSRCRRQSMT